MQNVCVFLTLSIFSSSTVLADSVDVNSLIQMCDYLSILLIDNRNTDK
jgi:hypothetical protein